MAPLGAGSSRAKGKTAMVRARKQGRSSLKIWD